LARADWHGVDEIRPVLEMNARIGGSRTQRRQIQRSGGGAMLLIWREDENGRHLAQPQIPG
jgi:hypothetical protein